MEPISIMLDILLFAVGVAAFLYGCVLCKEVFKELYVPRKKGLEQAVEKWEQLSSEERMEVNRQAAKEAKTFWVNSPKPQEEEKEKNERVFREGLIHEYPETKVE